MNLVNKLLLFGAAAALSLSCATPTMPKKPTRAHFYENGKKRSEWFEAESGDKHYTFRFGRWDAKGNPIIQYRNDRCTVYWPGKKQKRMERVMPVRDCRDISNQLKAGESIDDAL